MRTNRSESVTSVPLERIQESLPESLTMVLEEILAGVPGRVSLTMLTSGGGRWGYAGDRVVAAASTIKLPILVGALREVERGGLDLDALIELPDLGSRVGGAGAVALLPSVTRLTLRELLTLMVVLSDNDATNLVIDLLGERLADSAAQVARVVDDAVSCILPSATTHHGAGDGAGEGGGAGGALRATALRRRLMDFAAAEQGLQNTTSSDELAAVLAALRGGGLLGPAATRLALGILREQQHLDGLPSAVGPRVRTASKTGEIPGVRADVALFEVVGSAQSSPADPHGSPADPQGGQAAPQGDRWCVVAVLADGLLAEDGRDHGTAAIAAFARVGEVVSRWLAD